MRVFTSDEEARIARLSALFEATWRSSMRLVLVAHVPYREWNAFEALAFKAALSAPGPIENVPGFLEGLAIRTYQR